MGVISEMTAVLEKRTTTANLWGRLTTPHPSITDIEQRRQSRLLAGLTLTLLITTVFADILLTARASGQIPSTVQLLIPGQIFTLALYFLNRSGRYRLSA